MKKIVLILLLLGLSTPANADSFVPEESVKAAFIFHFLNFTQWNDHLSDYYVCIPDDESLLNTTQESLKGKIVNNRKIVVVSRYDNCHVLVSDYVPVSNSTLTIGPLAKGALLEFRLVDNRMRFAVNLAKIKKSRLKISSQMLKLAILENI